VKGPGGRPRSAEKGCGGRKRPAGELRERRVEGVDILQMSPPGLAVQRLDDQHDVAVLILDMPRPRRPTSLTDTEWDVARRVVTGASNEAIAKARGTSARTVANQLQSVFRKLGVDGRVSLTRALCAPGDEATVRGERSRR
jgi:DNA-binding CsgD family transcriptional regulator